MKKLYLLLSCLLSIQFLDAQVEWQEHFSHDRSAYEHIGQFVIDGKIVLVMGNWGGPMNTLETITGNTKKDAITISEFNEYLDIKTTTIGIKEKEFLLFNPFDYDIHGEGIYSVRSDDDSIYIRDIQRVGDEFPILYDIWMPLDSAKNIQCITNNANWLVLDNHGNVLDTLQSEGVFKFHETANEMFEISGSTLNPLNTPSGHLGGLELGQYDKIINDPYRSHIAIITGVEMKRHTVTNCDLIRTDVLEYDPIEVVFTEEGFYYLSETAENYIIYQYRDDLSQSEVWYELEKEGIIGSFDITSFEIIGDDIYFLGLLESTILRGFFSYVQKRNKNEPFSPTRNDIGIDSMQVTGTPTGSDPWDFWDYEYWYKVTNTGVDTLHHFSLVSDNMESATTFPRRLVWENVSVTLAPGESYEAIGNFDFYEMPSFRLYVVGVDYGLDSNPENNIYTADIISLSNNNVVPYAFQIAPNPASEYLSILNGATSEIKSVSIADIDGRKIKVQTNDFSSIDISDLPNGKYWLEIRTKTTIEKHPFIKI